MSLHVLGIVAFKVAITTAMERDNDRHDLTEGQLALTVALPLAVLEQASEIPGLKPLAKVVNIAEHGDELAHKNLRVVQAAFSDTATIRRSLWAGKTLPRIPN